MLSRICSKKVILICMVSVLAYFFFVGRALSERAEKKTPPLSEQLRGLDPHSKIAYLRYLIKSDSLNAEVFFQLGVAFQELEQTDSAIYYYNKSIEYDPGLSKALVNMGVVYSGKRLKAKAINMFERAIKVNPSDYLAYSHAAFLWFQLGNYKRAMEQIREALKIAPNEAQPHYYLAVFFWESGIYRESLVEWQRVIELDKGGELSKEAKENISLIQAVMSGGIGIADYLH